MSDAPPPEPPRDDEPTTPDAASPRPGGFVLDLSSSEGRSSTEPAAWKRKRKQASPVLTKIVDLSALPPPKAPDPPPPPKAKAKPHKKREASGSRPRSPRGGSTLADLLDPETLARLKSGD